MKMIYSIIIAIILFSINSKAQAPVYQWAKSAGSTTADRGNTIGVDASGNVYVAGAFTGTADFDPGAGTVNLVSNGGTDLFFAKYSPTGNLIWAKSIGGSTGTDQCLKMVIDAPGNCYIVGSYSGTVDFDPNAGITNLTNMGFADGFFAKYTTAGTLVWAKNIGGFGDEQVTGIAVDPTGQCYLTGTFTGASCDFDPGIGTANLPSFGSADVFFAKYDNLGNYIWGNSIGSSGINEDGRDIAIDASGDCYVTGTFRNTVDLDAGAGTVNKTSAGNTDIFIVKYNTAGVFAWGGSMGNTNNDGLASMAIGTDAAGNVYLAGQFCSVVDFDINAGVTTLTGSFGGACFLACYTGSGTFTFVKHIAAGSSSPDALGMKVDASGDIYLTGYFDNTGDFDPGAGVANLTSSGTSDAYFAKYDMFGNFIMVQRIGGTGIEQGGFGIASDADYVYVTGEYLFTADFDASAGTANQTSVGSTDVYFGKYAVCTSAPATPASISGTATICSGTANTYSITAVSGASSYTWTLPGGWTGTSTTNSINATASTTSGNITVTANNACGNSTPQTLAITVNTTPSTPGTISGTATICSGTTNTYSITAVAGATSYTWTLPGGWTGTSSTNSINATASSTSGNITVTANNACGNSTAQTLAIVVNTIPTTPGTISGLASMCIGTGAQTYSITAVGGATSYTWTLPATWSGTSTTNSIVATPGTSGGNITVTANNTCGNSSPQTLAVIINSLPVVTYSQSPALVCVNLTSVALGTVSPTGGIFTGTSVTGSTFNASTAGVGTYSITYTYTDGNGCVNSANSNITVDPCTGISQNAIDDEIVIYPNPATSVVILSGVEGTATIEVYNVLGKIVLAKQITNDKIEIDLSKETNGIYFIKVSSDTGTITKRIIKQ